MHIFAALNSKIFDFECICLQEDPNANNMHESREPVISTTMKDRWGRFLIYARRDADE